MDAAQLIPKVESRLCEAAGVKARITGCTPLLGGACQENLLLEVELDGKPQRLVLRADAPRSLPGSLDRAGELKVIEAVVAAGVNTPPARWLAPGLLREGAQAFFMDWREGTAIGRKVVRDEALATAREGLAAEVAGELAKVHGITPDTHPELCAVLGDSAIRPLERLCTSARETLDRAGEPRPALEYVLDWLERNAPADEEVTLVHGDLRTGNVLLTPDGLSAVLDWELAHWGSPAEDAAWLCVRDWRFGRLDLPVGGFAGRDAFTAAYAEASGRTLSAEALHYWEVYGNARWATGCLQQGERYAAGERDLELIAIERRTLEMEFEALRLIERGPK
jgi:aminoglycoside phosphotransferase (APT) family kinase protein